MGDNFCVAYIPIGVPTFHLESAQAEFEKSCGMLQQMTKKAVCPEKMLLSLDDLERFMDRICPDLIILQNITFANAAYAGRVIKKFDCPIILWTLREPAMDGGRLRLNSLTGAYSAANTLVNAGNDRFLYVFGSPDEIEVQGKIRAVIHAAGLKKKLSSLKIAAVGHTPQGFGFGCALESELQNTFGAELVSVEARELMELAGSYSDAECERELEETENCTVCFRKTVKQNQKDHAKLLRAYKEFVDANHIGALSSLCWPDFFTSYKTPVCTVLSMLNDRNVAAACEADVYGALSMYIGMQLTGSGVFFGDPVALDEKENTITYWHCGMAPCSLAHPVTGAQVGVHPNRKIGPVMDFGCKPCSRVTVFRVGRMADGSFRFFLTSGRALDKEKQFTGTSVVVQTEHDSRKIVESSVRDGWEPHFAVVYGNIKEELTALAKLLGLKVWEY